MFSTTRATCAALLIAAIGCSSDSTSPPPPTAVASLSVTPTTTTVAVGEDLPLTAVARDAQGQELTDRAMTWSSADPATVRVSGTGVVTGMRPGGPIGITVSSGGVSATAQVTVAAPVVASVEVSPPSSSMVRGTTLQLSATARDAAGNVIQLNVTTWGTSDEAVATVSASGLVTAVAAGGPVTITAYAGTETGSATITVTEPIVPATRLSVGAEHSCVVRVDESALCWGANTDGRLGDGTTSPHTRPAVVGGSLHFREIAAGGTTTCGIVTDGPSYCWGSGASGNLGTGGTANVLLPAPITPAGEVFAVIAPSQSVRSTCALGLSGAVYCWGADPTRIMTGLDVVPMPTLLPVGPTTPPVNALTLGENFGCGLSVAGIALCWGANDRGQLGDGTTARKSAPIEVAGGHAFRQIASGDAHSCGITTSGEIWCWGANNRGQLGDGTTTHRSVPVRVGSASDYIALGTGAESSCAIRANGSAWCWGYNNFGQLGDETQVSRSQPVAVVGGHSFSAIDAGRGFTCGLTNDGVYCWGRNALGQLGDASTVDRAVPTRVSGT